MYAQINGLKYRARKKKKGVKIKYLGSSGMERANSRISMGLAPLRANLRLLVGG